MKMMTRVVMTNLHMCTHMQSSHVCLPEIQVNTESDRHVDHTAWLLAMVCNHASSNIERGIACYYLAPCFAGLDDWEVMFISGHGCYQITSGHRVPAQNLTTWSETLTLTPQGDCFVFYCCSTQLYVDPETWRM